MPPNTRRGQLKIAVANDTNTVAPRTGIDPGGHETGAGALFDQLASGFSKQANVLGKIADKAAQTEGYEAGLSAGMDPEFRTRGDNTIRGNAFDMAGIKTAGNRLRSGMRTAFDAAYKEYGHDPAALQKALGATYKGFYGQATKIDKRLAADIQGNFHSASNRYMKKATRSHVKRVNEQYLSSTKADVDASVKGLQQDAYDGGLAEDTSDLLAADYIALREKLNAAGIDGKPLFKASARDRILKQTAEDIQIERVTGVFHRLDDIGAQQQMHDQLESDWGKRKGIAAGLDRKGLDKLRLRLGKHLAKQKTGQKVAVRALEGRIKDYKKLVDEGHSLPVDDLMTFETDWAVSPDDKVFQAYEKVVALDNFQQDFKLRRPARMAAMLAEKRALLADDSSRLSVDDRLQLADELETGEKLQATMDRELKTDPLAWAQKTGRYDIRPLDAANLQDSLAHRKAIGFQIARDYSLAIPSFFSPQEKQQMLASAYQGGEQFVALLGNITTAFGTDSAVALSQVFEKSPMLSQLGGMAMNAQTPHVVMQIADHLKFRRDDKAYKPRLPPRKKIMEYYQGSPLGSVLRDLPRTEQSIISMASVIADMNARAEGKLEADQGDFDKALLITIGQQTINGKTYGGIHTESGGWFGENRQTIIPPFIEADQFRPLVEGLRDNELEQLGTVTHGNGDKVVAAEMRNARLHYIGNGKYEVQTHSGYLADGNGKRWQLDFQKLSAMSGKRKLDTVEAIKANVRKGKLAY